MRKSTIIIDKDYEIADVDSRLFGSFIEHLGRAVYGGIYQPENISSDESGFRQDVLELVKELQVSVVRYPGGNFVSNYFWEDGVGPINQRHPRLDLAWKTIEPNIFGLGEFVNWAKMAGADIMMAVNLGTRGVADACNLLEYCNFPSGTKYSDLRKAYGIEEPYGIKLWCLGNEMDGEWQLGRRTMEEYGRISAEAGKAMKLIDPSIELVSCGSSSKGMPTFPERDAVTVEENYDYVDYLSLHQYYGNENNDSNDYLAKSDDMDDFIHTVVSVCDYVQAKKRSRKKMYLSFDEWNVWFHSKAEEENITNRHPWQMAPHLLEDHYTFEDALMVGLMLITLLNHADRVKIACLAQLVNVIAPIMAEDGGVWRQTIYYPFLHASLYGRGTVIKTVVNTPVHMTNSHGEVNDVVCSAVYLKEREELTIFVVNRNLSEDQELILDVRSFGKLEFLEKLVLISDSLKKENSLNNESIKPLKDFNVNMDKQKVKTVLKKASWNVIRLKKEAKEMRGKNSA